MRAARVAMLAATLLYGTRIQGQTTTNGKASTTGGCSVAHSGNNDVITIQNCGIGERQANTIIEILKAVLAHQNADERDAKLDELLETAKQIANPYRDVTTYSVDGVKRVTNSSTGSTRAINDGGEKMREMIAKEAAEDWRNLADLAQNYISRNPGWFTPFAFLGDAQANLCQVADAAAAYNKFIRDTEGAAMYASMRRDVQTKLAMLRNPTYLKRCGVD